jgi:hypothetical protein
MPSFCNITLISICIVQFFVILHLLSGPESKVGKIKLTKLALQPELNVTMRQIPVTSSILKQSSVSNQTEKLVGVAVTLMLHSPTWFQRRNTIMINNVRNNLPHGWKVQIFYMGYGQSQNAIDINPGLKKLIDNNDVILTRIPDTILEKKKKGIHLLTEIWLWTNMVAPRVLLFGGNSVICSNSPLSLSSFSQFDYIGAPWDNLKGVGGDGGISIRSRDVMIAVINYGYERLALKHGNDPKASMLISDGYLHWVPDDLFFVSHMIEMNKKKIANFSIADRASTLRFAATGSAANSEVLVVSGTLPVLPYDDRNKFMLTCPELKMLYPSLHDPHCFGAKPNGTKCAKTICALEVPRRKGGC